jgi:choline/glycine/proline betaine transport protein
MLEQLPLAFITSVVAMVVIATFFITSSDSGSLVDDIHACGGSLEPRWQTRAFWALAEGSVAGVLLLAGGETGLEAFQQASIMTGVPLAILLLLMCYAIFRALREDHAEFVARERSRQRTPAPCPTMSRSRPTSHGDGDFGDDSG